MKAIKINKYKIIEPFLKKEKKLKELSEEHEIPYSTLKRWIKSYKESGDVGLQTKVRSDKDSFRKADKEIIKYIKNEYKKDKNLNITNLYKNYQRKFKSNNITKVSYNTIYRIATTLDPFSQKYVKDNLKKIKKSNYIYRISTEKIYIKNLGINNDIANIIILYDVYDDSIINYKLLETPPTVNHYLTFIRESILKNKVENYIVIPNMILIDEFKIKDKEKFYEILEWLKININGILEKNIEITKFISYLEKDIKIIFKDKNITLDSLNKDLEEYICNIVLREIKDENKVFDFEKLNYLLEKTKRKVHTIGIKFKNNIYNDEKLKDYLGKILTIRYDFSDLSQIKIYLEDEFLFTLYKK